MKKMQLLGRGLLVACVLSLGLAMPAFAETVEVRCSTRRRNSFPTR